MQGGELIQLIDALVLLVFRLIPLLGVPVTTDPPAR